MKNRDLLETWLELYPDVTAFYREDAGHTYSVTSTLVWLHSDDVILVNNKHQAVATDHLINGAGIKADINSAKMSHKLSRHPDFLRTDVEYYTASQRSSKHKTKKYVHDEMVRLWMLAPSSYAVYTRAKHMQWRLVNEPAWHPNMEYKLIPVEAAPFFSALTMNINVHENLGNGETRKLNWCSDFSELNTEACSMHVSADLQLVAEHIMDTREDYYEL